MNRELPRISPEMVFFRAGDAVRRFAVMPAREGGELYVIAVNGECCVLTPQEWEHYRAMCRHADETVFAREGLHLSNAA